MLAKCFGEFMGTVVLILLGDGGGKRFAEALEG